MGKKGKKRKHLAINLEEKGKRELNEFEQLVAERTRINSKTIGSRDGLVEEYNMEGKANIFRDKRYGQYNKKMDKETKMQVRFARERQSRNKISKYKLDEDDEDGQTFKLTHLGKNLEDMDDFQDIIENSDDEEDNQLNKELNERIVNELHFGEGNEQQTLPLKQKKKTRKEIYDEIILKSKIHKAKKYKEKMEKKDLTKEVNNDFLEIAGLLKKRNKDYSTEKDDFESIRVDLKDNSRIKLNIQSNKRKKLKESESNEGEDDESDLYLSDNSDYK